MFTWFHLLYLNSMAFPGGIEPRAFHPPLRNSLEDCWRDRKLTYYLVNEECCYIQLSYAVGSKMLGTTCPFKSFLQISASLRSDFHGLRPNSPNNRASSSKGCCCPSVVRVLRSLPRTQRVIYYQLESDPPPPKSPPPPEKLSLEPEEDESEL